MFRSHDSSFSTESALFPKMHVTKLRIYSLNNNKNKQNIGTCNFGETSSARYWGQVRQSNILLHG
jgi:hypothetical protein